MNKDIITLKEKVLKMLSTSQENNTIITQQDVWKNLGIPRRDGGKLVKKMIEENLISKTKHKNTFAIELLVKSNGNGDRNGNGNGNSKKKSNTSPLLSNKGTFSPCASCHMQCLPAYCEKLDNWIRE